MTKASKNLSDCSEGTEDSSVIKKAVLDNVISFYRSGTDFNGLPIMWNDQLPERVWDAIDALVVEGELQVVTGKDYPNPHIRPWSSRRTTEDQRNSLRQIRSHLKDGDEDRVCLYPTPAAMKTRLARTTLLQEPYRRELAKGNGTLELRYFAFDSLEGYRNDPRYHFDYWDFGLNFGIGDDAYLDENEPDQDRISSTEAGFAYVLPPDETGPIVRRICMFLGDLSKLTPEHQRRLESFEIKGAELDSLKPHPMWFGSQIGNWADGLGPFEKILLEMKAINELTTNTYGANLFTDTERPREFGWVLRASQTEWDNFVHLADKLLSENMSHASLDVIGAPRLDNEGRTIGSINRLQLVLEAQTTVDPQLIKERLQVFRVVRSARQKPAHVLRQNVNDQTIIRKQRDLLGGIATSMQSLRIIFSRHPANSDWKPESFLDKKHYSL